MAARDETSVNQLLKRVKAGDREARKRLVALLGNRTQFGSALLAMARRLLPRDHPARRSVDSMDIVQSALRTGLNHLSDFRGGTESEFFGWLRAILRSKVNRASRSKEARLRRLGPDTIERQQEECGERDFLSSIIREELLGDLHRAVSELPLDQRLVVELQLRGVRTAEIARLLGLKPETVRKRSSRATRQLRQRFSETTRSR